MNNTSENSANYYQIPVGFQEDKLSRALKEQQEKEQQAAIEAVEKELAVAEGMAHGAMREVSVKTEEPKPPIAEKIVFAPTPDYNKAKLSPELTEKASELVHKVGCDISTLRLESNVTHRDYELTA